MMDLFSGLRGVLEGSGSSGETAERRELPDDSGEKHWEFPSDSGGMGNLLNLPDDTGWRPVSQERFDGLDKNFHGGGEMPLVEVKPQTYHSLDEMKAGMDKSYSEIKAEKPLNSPNIPKWFENGGSITAETKNGKSIWTYTDGEGRQVSYVDGKIVFPPEAKHPVIGDINIDSFTGDRNEDKRLYLEKLEELYGLTEIPEGYALHHDSENGNMQLIRVDYHQEFTHAGGHSMFKEES